MAKWNTDEHLKTSLIADVDCTAGGKSACDAVGVRGYPTIKWGDASALEDYKGGRDYDSLLKFAEENLKPMCSPSNIDLCDDDKQKEIAALQAMSPADLAAQITENTQKMKDAEAHFEKEVKALQDKYSKLQTDKEQTIA